MDVDYEDNIEIISETTNNLEQLVNKLFCIRKKNTIKKKVFNQDSFA
jgi:hypothetical protein